MKNTKPTKADWTAVGNDFRRVLGQPPYKGNDTMTEDVLVEWEKLVPGSRARLEAMAQREMEHRLEMEAWVNSCF
jgi:hypothetical protein